MNGNRGDVPQTINEWEDKLKVQKAWIDTYSAIQGNHKGEKLRERKV